MQDRYAGDIGDFGKFALLKGLQEAIGGTLGIVWYRVLDETHNNDGKHVGYLDQNKFKSLDDALLSGLKKVAEGRPRSIAALESAVPILSASRCFSTDVPKQSRQEWLRAAVDHVSTCSVVFLDPDNWISTERERSPKHVTTAEVKAFFDQVRLLVIYHHLDRSGSHDSQLDRWIEWVSKTLGNDGHTFAVRYRRGTSRAYFVAAKDASTFHMALTAAEGLGEWIRRGHFDKPRTIPPVSKEPREPSR